MSNRDTILAEQVRQLLSHALCFQMRDSMLRAVTITSVKVSGDLQFADMKITTAGERAEPVMAALTRASRAFRHIIAKNIKIRRVPQLRWHLDRSAEARQRVDEILGSLSIPPEEVE